MCDNITIVVLMMCELTVYVIQFAKKIKITKTKIVTNKPGAEHLCVSWQHCSVSFLNESDFEQIILILI